MSKRRNNKADPREGIEQLSKSQNPNPNEIPNPKSQ